MNSKNLPERFKDVFKYLSIYRIHEELTTEMFRKVVKQGDIVVDIGANIGYFTLLASRLVGEKGRVYAFEPEPVNYSCLVRNIEINGYKNIIPVQKAASNIIGTVRLFIANENSGAHNIRKYCNAKEFLEVEAVTLDDYFRDKRHPINVVKMDIEGMEMAALSGMDRILRENENLKLFAEFNPALIRETDYTAEQFARKLLEGCHFSVTAIDDYAKNKRFQQINSFSELMDLCGSSRLGYVNLFAEKA